MNELLNGVSEVKQTYEETTANELLSGGWWLLYVGVDADSDPLYILGRNQVCDKCNGIGGAIVNRDWIPCDCKNKKDVKPYDPLTDDLIQW